MAVYGPGCHPQNIIWTEAKLSQHILTGVASGITAYTLRSHKITLCSLRARLS